MTLKLTTLVADGARYQCCFNFTLYGLDRCKRDATGAITESAYHQTFDAANSTTKHLFLHGRAVCSIHARVLAEDFGITDTK